MVGRFADSAAYRVKLRGGLHARIHPFVHGRIGTGFVWHGRFRVDVGVFEGSSRIDTCHLRDDTWTASPAQ